MMIPLVLAYLIASVITYSDYPNENEEIVLKGEEHLGLTLWRRHNCQVCHQLHGFGGFLGPDLTNVVGAETEVEDFRSILTRGKRQMPAFDFDEKEQRAIYAFLGAMNRTGRSIPQGLKNGRQVYPYDHFGQLCELYLRQSGSLRESVSRGLKTFGVYACSQCHIPFTAGKYRAPDLTAAATERSPDFLRRILRSGTGKMPSYQLSEREIADIAVFLQWVGRNRETLVGLNKRLLRREDFSWKRVPWFEYR